MNGWYETTSTVLCATKAWRFLTRFFCGVDNSAPQRFFSRIEQLHLWAVWIFDEQQRTDKWLLCYSSSGFCFDSRSFARQATLPTLSCLAKALEQVSFCMLLSELIFTVFPLMYAVFKTMVMDRLITCRMHISSILRRIQNSSCIKPFTTNCVFATDCSRVAFFVAAFLSNFVADRFSSANLDLLLHLRRVLPSSVLFWCLMRVWHCSFWPSEKLFF